MNPRIPLPVVGLLLLLILFALTSPACASDQVVTDFGDNGGTNQLRAKLTALQNSGGGTLTFAGGTATIVLVNGVLPTITRNTIIDGDNRVTISGNHATHIFYVNGVLTLTNITITDGYYPIWPLGDGGAARNYGTLNINNSRFLRNQTTPDFSGGAIVTYGILNITNSEFGYNKGGNGGAIYLGSAAAVATIVGSNFHDNEATDPKNSHGGAILLSEGASMTVDSSRFNNNKASVGTGSQAVGGGGAVYMRADSTVTMTNTVLEGNLAAGVGGAIVNQGTLTLVNSNVSGNSATYLFGGGIDSAFGSNTFTNTIVSNNFASVQGGGISMFMGTANLTNVTFNSNSVGFGGQGAGLYNYSGTATLTNTTLSANSGTGRAGAIVNTGTISLVNTTVIGNEAPQIQHFNDAALATLKNTLIAQGGFSGNCFGAFTSLGGNLSDDDSCSFGAGRDHVNILLGPLANNGGFTETHLPLPGSIAIDNGIASGAPARDQRGYLRVGSAPDVGAAEFGGTIPVSLANISTRGIVETGNSALIGGFIIRGGGPKKMIL